MTSNRKIDYFYNKTKTHKPMRKPIYILFTLTFLLSGCSKQQTDSDKLLNEIEKIIEVNPDSASNMLSNIPSPEKTCIP